MKVQFIDDDLDEAIITVRWGRRFLFWKLEPEVKQYRGSSTIWRDAQTGKRQNTATEAQLCDAWTKARWQAQDALKSAAQ